MPLELLRLSQSLCEQFNAYMEKLRSASRHLSLEKLTFVIQLFIFAVSISVDYLVILIFVVERSEDCEER